MISMEQFNNQAPLSGPSSLLSIILSVVITALVVGGATFFFISPRNNYSLNTPAPVTTPSDTPEGEPDTPTEITPVQQTQMATVVKEQGYIKSIYSKNGRMYLDIDYVSECISDFEEAARAILEDKKCPAGVTLNQLVQEMRGAGNASRLCPNQPFGYGSGYCYFRNQNAQIRTLEISPDVIVLYPMHPYDFDTQDLYDGAYAYQITLDWLKDRYEYTKGNPFEVILVNNIVTVIRKIFVSAE